MVTSKGKRYKLRYLAALTALMLMCIIALQFYWLYTSYAQQRKRFLADVNSTIKEAALYQSMINAYNTAGNGAPGSTSSVVINFTNSNSKVRTQKPFTVKVEEDEAESRHPSVFISSPAINSSVVITPQKLDSLLDSCKTIIVSELKQREIHTPFELAIIDDKGAIIKATCDTPRFHRTPIKTHADPLISDDKHAKISLQAAFPNANIFLLRRMAIILIVTSLLILIGAWSFSYMVIQFFRQKKIADIRNDFMNNMTHELKTPISSSLVALEMVEGKRHPLDETAKLEYLGIAKNELSRLSMLIDKVLKMAAFDQKEILLTKSAMLVDDMLKEANDNLCAVIVTGRAEVKINIEPSTLTFYGDRVHLVNVFQNLIENAIKYNDKPSPLVTVSASGREGGGVMITVDDNGRGIPASYVSKVFDKFFRVPFGDVHDIKGYGLGLSYVKAIVVLHGGTVSVSSKEREGSIFTVFLPAK